MQNSVCQRLTKGGRGSKGNLLYSVTPVSKSKRCLTESGEGGARRSSGGNLLLDGPQVNQQGSSTMGPRANGCRRSEGNLLSEPQGLQRYDTVSFKERGDHTGGPPSRSYRGRVFCRVPCNRGRGQYAPLALVLAPRSRSRVGDSKKQVESVSRKLCLDSTPVLNELETL